MQMTWFRFVPLVAAVALAALPPSRTSALEFKRRPPRWRPRWRRHPRRGRRGRQDSQRRLVPVPWAPGSAIILGDQNFSAGVERLHGAGAPLYFVLLVTSHPDAVRGRFHGIPTPRSAGSGSGTPR